MAPGRKTNPREPLHPLPEHSSGDRLVKLIGISPETYLSAFDRVNCLPFYPGSDKNIKGDKFPMKKAREAAAVHRQHFGGRHVIFLGRNTAVAFGYPKATMDFFEHRNNSDWGFTCTVVPHTSGCNRFWNCDENRARAREYFREVLEKYSPVGFTSATS